MVTILDLREPINRSKIISPVLHPSRFESIKGEIEETITGKPNQHYFFVFGPYLAVFDDYIDSILNKNVPIAEMHPIMDLAIKHPDNIKLFVALKERSIPIEVGVQVLKMRRIFGLGTYDNYGAYIEDIHDYSIGEGGINIFKNNTGVSKQIEYTIDRLILDTTKTRELKNPEDFPRENILTISQIKARLDSLMLKENADIWKTVRSIEEKLSDISNSINNLTGNAKS